jgi:hypothetical protein
MKKTLTKSVSFIFASSLLILLTLLIGAEGARLLREKQVKRDPREASAEEAPGPPAENECLERKSTGKFKHSLYFKSVVIALIHSKFHYQIHHL